MGTVHTPVTAAAQQVHFPATQGKPHVALHNETAVAGPAGVIYVGQSGVTPASGLPLLQGQHVRLDFCPVPLHAVSAAVATATATTTSAAITAGVTTVPVNAGAGIGNGRQVQVGAGSAAETLTVTAGGGTNSLTVAPATSYDHKTGSAVTVVTAQGGDLRVESGFH
jgi:hypothetical protein